MSMNNGMRPVHPGETLAEDLEELGSSANALARDLDVPTNRVAAILKGQRGQRLIQIFAFPDTLAPLSNYGKIFRTHSSCAWRKLNLDRRSKSVFSDEERPGWAVRDQQLAANNLPV